MTQQKCQFFFVCLFFFLNQAKGSAFAFMTGSHFPGQQGPQSPSNKSLFIIETFELVMGLRDLTKTMRDKEDLLH